MAFKGAKISLTHAAAQTLTTTEAELVFNTDDFDVGGSWIDDTTNKRLKIPLNVEYVKFTITASVSAMLEAEVLWSIHEETLGRIWSVVFVSDNVDGNENMIWTFPVTKVSAGEVYFVNVDLEELTETSPVLLNILTTFSVVDLT